MTRERAAEIAGREGNADANAAHRMEGEEEGVRSSAIEIQRLGPLGWQTLDGARLSPQFAAHVDGLSELKFSIPLGHPRMGELVDDWARGIWNWYRLRTDGAKPLTFDGRIEEISEPLTRHVDVSFRILARTVSFSGQVLPLRAGWGGLRSLALSKHDRRACGGHETVLRRKDV